MTMDSRELYLACVHLGTLSYPEAWRYQESLLKQLVQAKLARRRGHTAPILPHYLLFCYHPPVITLGKSADNRHLLSSSTQLQQAGIHYYQTNRGGDITYHGPGQLVVYPILDLECFYKDIHRYMRSLEEVVIATLSEYGVQGTRISGLTGVWVPNADGIPQKIAAIGVRCSHWVSMHGLAFNLQVNLTHFKHIIPCGISDKAVTSLHKVLDRPSIPLQEAEDRLLYHFRAQFQVIPFSYLKRPALSL